MKIQYYMLKEDVIVLKNSLNITACYSSRTVSCINANKKKGVETMKLLMNISAFSNTTCEQVG